MEQTWPDGVERVAAYLRTAGAEARLEQLGESTSTAEEAAKAVGCRLGQIVKSLVFECDGTAVVVLVPGDKRADPTKVAVAVGGTVARIATSEEVLAATDFPPGAVAPFPLPKVPRVLVEQTLLANPVVWVGAGLPATSRRLRRTSSSGSPAAPRWTWSWSIRNIWAEMLATDKIWMNGELVDWADATVHVGTHGLHYGSGVFEGIRAYDTPKGSAVFRLTDHLQRLQNSARLLYMDLPFTVSELRSATLDLIAHNGLPACYVRPIAFYGFGELGVAPGKNPVDVVIMSWPWGAYLGEDALAKGISAKISSWKRVGPNVIPHVAKATGIYLNSMLATMEARRAGYEEAILLTDEGTVADGPGENIFVVRDGTIFTPDLSTTSILPGITRNSIVQIAEDLGHTVVEKSLIRSDLYLADEVFMTGTAAEVTPVRAVDDQEIGDPGPITLEIQKAYLDTVHGRSARYEHWLEYATRTPAEA